MTKKRSFTIKGHRTSIALEDEFWRALEALAEKNGCTLVQLITRVDQSRVKAASPPGLASALRVYALTKQQ